METRKYIGMLTPSSNTVLEPITNKILNSVDNVTAHFSRFTVTEISSNPNSINQFDYSKIVESAKLLADAKVDVIAWNGTSAGWLGFESDENLCKEIKKATGIDGISPKLLHFAIPVLTKQLTKIVNLAITLSTFTVRLKEAHVAPVHKKTGVLEAGNYRPVSVLSAISEKKKKSLEIQLAKYIKSSILFWQPLVPDLDVIQPF